MVDRPLNIRGRARGLWLLFPVAVLAVAAVVITALVDDSTLRAPLEGQASAALGMDVAIERPLGVGLWPTPGVTAESLPDHSALKAPRPVRVLVFVASTNVADGRHLQRFHALHSRESSTTPSPALRPGSSVFVTTPEPMKRVKGKNQKGHGSWARRKPRTSPRVAAANA
jgi:hypothetical protein